jgi:hypothetical protein
VQACADMFSSKMWRKQLRHGDSTHVCRLIAVSTVPAALHLLRTGATLAARPLRSAVRINNCMLLALAQLWLTHAHPDMLTQVPSVPAFAIIPTIRASAVADACAGSTIVPGMVMTTTLKHVGVRSPWATCGQGVGKSVLSGPLLSICEA